MSTDCPPGCPSGCRRAGRSSVATGRLRCGSRMSATREPWPDADLADILEPPRDRTVAALEHRARRQPERRSGEAVRAVDLDLAPPVVR